MILPASFISEGMESGRIPVQSISLLNSFPTFLFWFSLRRELAENILPGANLFELIGIEDKIVRARSAR